MTHTIMPKVVIMPGTQSSTPNNTLRSVSVNEKLKVSMNIHHPRAHCQIVNHSSSMQPMLVFLPYQHARHIYTSLTPFRAKAARVAADKNAMGIVSLHAAKQTKKKKGNSAKLGATKDVAAWLMQ